MARPLLVALAVTVGSTLSALAAETGLLVGLESSPLLVVGEVRAVQSLPHVGYAAEVVVERVLRGEAHSDFKSGDHLLIAWEEPSPKVPPRIQEGRRLIAAVRAAPTASIWKLRVPDPARRKRLRSLAGKAQGYLHDLSGGTLTALEHYLALTASAQAGEAGAVYLARLVAVAPPRLAMDALERLRAEPDRVAALPAPGGQALVAALLRTDSEQVVTRTVSLVGEARPGVLGPFLEKEIAERAGSVPLQLLAARAALEGGLPEDLAEEMSKSSSEADRIAAARWAAGPGAVAQLRRRLAGDRSPAVREAALRRLVSIEGVRASDQALHGLDDAAPGVRLVAVESLASFGSAVIPELRRVIDGGSTDASLAGVAAISIMTGEEARAELRELADNHSSKAVRALAGVALQRPLGED